MNNVTPLDPGTALISPLLKREDAEVGQHILEPQNFPVKRTFMASGNNSTSAKKGLWASNRNIDETSMSDVNTIVLIKACEGYLQKLTIQGHLARGNRENHDTAQTFTAWPAPQQETYIDGLAFQLTGNGNPGSTELVNQHSTAGERPLDDEIQTESAAKGIVPFGSIDQDEPEYSEDYLVGKEEFHRTRNLSHTLKGIRHQKELQMTRLDRNRKRKADKLHLSMADFAKDCRGKIIACIEQTPSLAVSIDSAGNYIARPVDGTGDSSNTATHGTRIRTRHLPARACVKNDSITGLTTAITALSTQLTVLGPLHLHPGLASATRNAFTSEQQRLQFEQAELEARLADLHDEELRKGRKVEIPVFWKKKMKRVNKAVKKEMAQYRPKGKGKTPNKKQKPRCPTRSKKAKRRAAEAKKAEQELVDGMQRCWLGSPASGLRDTDTGAGVSQRGQTGAEIVSGGAAA